MLWTVLLITLCVAVAAYAILGLAQFGKNPEGADLARMQTSRHYADGGFVNTVPTIMLLEGENVLKLWWKTLTSDKKDLRPLKPLPTVKIDLKALDPAQDVLLWLGHSSYYVQLAGKRLLIDPVFSAYGAPFSFLNKSFAGTDIYTAADMPALDFLLISHDHWDHLDHATALELRDKVKTVITPLGVSGHLARWGFAPGQLVEADWDTALHFAAGAGKAGETGGKAGAASGEKVNEKAGAEFGAEAREQGGLTVHVVTARHYSGRTFTRNKTQWGGFVLESAQRRLFFSGDSGFGPHFADIARRFDGFDLALLDGGQYDPRWPFIHMTPEEAVQAAAVLGARAMVLGHAGRFAIAAHSWDDPFNRAVAAVQAMQKAQTAQKGEAPNAGGNAGTNSGANAGGDADVSLPCAPPLRAPQLLTPRLGEPVPLDGTGWAFSRWW